MFKCVDCTIELYKDEITDELNPRCPKCQEEWDDYEDEPDPDYWDDED